MKDTRMTIASHEVLGHTFDLFTVPQALGGEPRLYVGENDLGAPFAMAKDFWLHNFDAPPESLESGDFQFQCKLSLCVSLPGLDKSKSYGGSPAYNEVIGLGFDVSVILSKEQIDELKTGTGRPGSLVVTNYILSNSAGEIVALNLTQSNLTKLPADNPPPYKVAQLVPASG